MTLAGEMWLGEMSARAAINFCVLLLLLLVFFFSFFAFGVVRTRNQIQGINHEIFTGFRMHSAMLTIKDCGKTFYFNSKRLACRYVCIVLQFACSVEPVVFITDIRIR